MKASLRACGFEQIDEVADADAAIELATRTQPHAIIVDIDVAGLRGVGIVSALLVAVPESAVIVASHFDGIRFPALEAGAAACVGKADPRELRRCLGQVGTPPSSPRTEP